VDEELLKQQQAVYSVAGVDESVRNKANYIILILTSALQTPAAPVAAREKKRKTQDSNDINTSSGPPKKRGKKGVNDGPNDYKPPPSKNTAVYVSHLPLDATVDEIAERFGKFGVIMEDDAGEPKIKMYADENGNFIGDALVVYFMEDSVTLAVNLLDDAELRLGDSGTVMKVKRGEFGHKQATDAAGAPAPRRVVDKKKATHRIAKLKR
jgi:HIV Tat-specific factor 1